MSRTAAAPGQLDMLALLAPPPPPGPPACLFGSRARGIAARVAEFDAWKEAHGNPGSALISHAWTPEFVAPSQPTSRCQPSALWCDTRLDDHLKPLSACGCVEVFDALLYRGACTGCDWEGPRRTDHNQAIEDACDHAHPGWRDLPTVPKSPPYGTSKQAKAAIAQWIAKVNRVYPAGWLEAGGPIRTLRTGLGTRHAERGTPFGGYDLAIVQPGEPQ